MSEIMVARLQDYFSLDWYSSEDPRSPQGSWVDSVTISRPPSGEWGEQKVMLIHVSLINRDQTAKIDLTYKGVHSYSLDGYGHGKDPEGRGEWLQDELINKHSLLRHKVTLVNGSMVIDAKDIEYRWEAIQSTPSTSV